MVGLSCSLGDDRIGPVPHSVGVSTATVSRYLMNPLSIRVRHRLPIEAAIQELGYVPHGAARALASRHSRIVHTHERKAKPIVAP